MSYAGSASDAYRQAGVYTGRVLKGESGQPTSAAVDQGRTDRNLKTAKALGLSFPLSLLGHADEVIE